MDTIWVIIAIIISILIGCIASWIVLKNKNCSDESKFSTKGQDQTSEEIKQLKQSLNEAINNKDRISSEKKELEESVKDSQSLLLQKESELSDLRTKIKNLSEMPSDAKERILIESLREEIEEKKNKLEQQYKELKDKENEINDLEENVDDLNKKLNKTKENVRELNDQVEKSKKKIGILENDLRNITAERDEIKVEDNLKSEAINFVNAILTAKDADDRDAKRISENVSKIESIIFDQYIPLQRQYYKEWDGLKNWIANIYEITFHWTNLQRKSWLNQKKVIAFIGEFSAGKTSIVNRILSQDDPNCPRLPEGGKATTAIPTYISYGEGFRSLFTDANGDLKTMEKEFFTKVNKEILAKVNVSSIIQYFIMKYKNDYLKGLSILDTPGFSSNDNEDKERTLHVINEADALFWVFDANLGEINRTSVEIIADNIKEIPLYIIINKADTKSPGELNDTEAKIKKTMQDNHINVAGYIRFSQKAKLNDLMNIIESLPDARTGLDICEICFDLRRDITHTEQLLSTRKTDIREITELLENREEILNEDIQDVVEFCNEIISIPQYNSRFLAKDDYRMEQDEYERLSTLCDAAVERSSQIKICYDDYKDFIAQYHKDIESQNNDKEQLIATKNIYTQLMNAIKNLDQKLYTKINKAVEDRIKEMIKEEANQNNN